MSATSTSSTKPTVRTVRRATTPDQFNLRLWRGLTILFAVVTVLSLATYLVLAIQWVNAPFFGTMVTQTLAVNSSGPSTGVRWPGLEAGLQFQDVILEINGQVLNNTSGNYEAAHETFTNIVYGLNPGDEITVLFQRKASIEDVDLATCEANGPSSVLCTVSYTVNHLPAGDLLTFFIIPFIAGSLAFISALVILWLRSRQPVALIAVMISLFASIFMAGITDLGSTYTLSPLWLLSSCWLGGAMLTLSIVFPTPIRIAYRTPVIRFIPFIVTSVLGAIAVAQYYSISDPRQHGLSMQIATMTLIVSVVLTAVILFFYQRRVATSQVARDQSNSIFIGVLMVIIPSTIWLFNRVLQGMDLNPIPFSFEGMMLFFIFPIAAIMYSVIQYRRINTDHIISQTVTYVIMLSALITGYFLLILGFTFLTQEFIPANHPLMVAGTIGLIAVLFIPVRVRLQEFIDSIYFRARHDYQQRSEELGQQLTSKANYQDILKTFEDLLDETINPSRVFVFLFDRQRGDYAAFGNPKSNTDIHFGADSGVVTTLSENDQAIYLDPQSPWPPLLQVDRQRLQILQARVIVGLPGTDQLNGFIIIGPPRSGEKRYNYEEMRFITNIVGQVAISVERAQVINSLERRVQELNVLSQIGQAVNFTIAFDDLLELISAQTSRLIDAAYFYIAMYDPSVDQIYFAFFLENNERHRSKEEKRWHLGRDLFSEVVRNSSAMHVEDYGRETNRREVTSDLSVHPHLKAWMGVPLIAGPRTLGVIAAAKTKIGEAYTDEQFQIFNNIGALAASAIDKTRLFSETEMRARQLSVLNEISRQLVATELDAERLLELITSSAVEILNAEAGSLFLKTDDDSDDLEFRVVIGGAEELVGTRISAGHGVVGQVAVTGQPMMSNDPEHDPHHATDVTEDFRTNSLLAVPLIAKDKVIGVLEVINKKDGSFFVEQDVDLLTTFAGQGAVAIENARMFRMTDIQLQERVQELEMLERIDNELNRTLDLNQVAEISLRWAVSNCKAEAGALGIVYGSPPYLKIVAIHGYLDEEYPTGAQGMIWPLNEGIIKRVMRTRNADYVPYTDIDPDYKSGLTNSLSQITIPMFTADEISAILILETNQEPRFTLQDWAFTQRLAEHASIAIANAQLYSELMRANETKSEFMGFAAHELKNPLTSVMGYADTVLKGAVGELNDVQKKMIGVIRSNADRMETIISDLRDAAKADANQLNIEPAPIDFHHVVLETLRPFMQQIQEKGQEINQIIDDDLPMVMGDQNRLIQVLTNLVSNAHKYSPPQTTITLKAESKDVFRTRKGQTLRDILHVQVTDQGIGMGEEDLAKIFRVRYFRSDNPETRDQPGTGLGMMITQAIVEGHGGEIWVESELGVGSTFHFIVPLAQEETVQKDQRTELASD